MSTVLGIDLGAHSVKVAILEGQLRKTAIRGYLDARVPASEDGAPPTLEQRLAVASDLLSRVEDRENATIVAAFPAESASVRVVKMPFADKDRIAQTLRFELEGFVPFDLDEFVLDWRVEHGGNEGGARVVCAMAPQADVRARLRGLGAIEAEPRHLVLDADVIGALADAHGVQALVDLGHARTLITVVRAGEVLGARAMSTGGLRLTQRLAQALRCSPADAEAAKHAARLAGDLSPVVAEWEDESHTQPTARPPTSSGAAQALREGAAELAAELRASLVALEDELGVGIDDVALCGGTADLEGLVPVLSADLGVPVRRLMVSEEAMAAGGAGRFGLAHALALRGAGLTRGRELHFRHGEFAWKGDVARVRAAMSYGAVALLSFLVATSVLYGVKRVGYARDLAQVEAEIGQVVLETFPEIPPETAGDVMTARAVMTEMVGASTARVEALGSLTGAEPPVLGAIKGISDTLPPAQEAKIDVKELTVSETAISFKADTTGYEAAANIEKALQQNPRFKGAKKGDEKKMGDGVTFSITVPLVTEPAAEEEG
jgi:Tfp pilus assembly PilM family ATPase